VKRRGLIVLARVRKESKGLRRVTGKGRTRWAMVEVVIDVVVPCVAFGG